MIGVDYLRKREEAGLTQAELARRTGYSRTHVINVENGRSRAGTEYTGAFLAALEGTVSARALATDQEMRGLPPTGRTRQKLKDTAVRLEHTLGSLEVFRRMLDSGIRSTRDASQMLETISGNALELIGFDPLYADEVEKNRVTRYIVSVLAEMIMDHGFQQLEDDLLMVYLLDIAKAAAKEVRKTKHRGASL